MVLRNKLEAHKTPTKLHTFASDSPHTVALFQSPAGFDVLYRNGAGNPRLDMKHFLIPTQ